MKRICSIALLFLASAGFAAAQSGASPATDVLGAHLNYGRGCAGLSASSQGAASRLNMLTISTFTASADL